MTASMSTVRVASCLVPSVGEAVTLPSVLYIYTQDLQQPPNSLTGPTNVELCVSVGVSGVTCGKFQIMINDSTPIMMFYVLH